MEGSSDHRDIYESQDDHMHVDAHMAESTRGDGIHMEQVAFVQSFHSDRIAHQNLLEGMDDTARHDKRFHMYVSHTISVCCTFEDRSVHLECSTPLDICAYHRTSSYDIVLHRDIRRFFS